MIHCIRNKIIVIFCFICSLSITVSQAELRDPTRPINYTNTEESNPWQLEAILISADRRIAIIDGKSVTVGDEVNGKKIVAIEASSVILESAEGRTTLNLFETSIKQKLGN